MDKKNVEVITKKDDIVEEVIFVQGYRRHEITVRKENGNSPVFKMSIKGFVDNNGKVFNFDMYQDYLEELRIIIDEALKNK